MDMASVKGDLEAASAGLAEAVERLTAHGLAAGDAGFTALGYAQSFAELAESLACARRNLDEVCASLDAEAPALRAVIGDPPPDPACAHGR